MLLNFDYDGVIVDSFDQLLELAIAAQENLDSGRPPTGEDFRTIENLTFDDLARRIGLSDDVVGRYAQEVFELQKQRWNVAVFPEIVPVFQELAEQHTLVVITASQSDAVSETLKDFGLYCAISQVLGGELGATKSARIAMSREAFHFDRSDTFMIGDAISDIRQGKLAQVQTVAVTWGFQDLELLKIEKPDFVVDEPRDLLKLVV